MKTILIIVQSLYVVTALIIISTPFLFGCTQEVVEPDKDETLCLYWVKPPGTDGSCIPNCPPTSGFDRCIEKWEAYKYDGKDKWRVLDCRECE